MWTENYPRSFVGTETASRPFDLEPGLDSLRDDEQEEDT
jgi:hypothetical protein